jgi:nucleoside-diphosphate-sugar epimerase
VAAAEIPPGAPSASGAPGPSGAPVAERIRPFRRALVTGGTGFLGHRLVAALLAEGVEVLALGRRPGALDGVAHPALGLVLGDLRNESLLAGLLARADTVFHLAATRSGRGSAAEMREVNEAATLRLARLSGEAGVGRFVQVSSATIFGPGSEPRDETAPVLPERAVGAYGASRARAQLALRRLAAEGLPLVTLLPTIVYGPDHPAHPNRVTSQVRRLLRAPLDVVVAGGTARRDLVHAGDVVAALLAAARRPEAAGEEILVTGEPVSQRGLAAMVARCAGRRIPPALSLPAGLARGAARLLDRGLGYDAGAGLESAVEALASEWLFSGDRGRALLGLRPRSLRGGIAETVAWIREKGS